MTVLLLYAALFAFLASGCGSINIEEPGPNPADATANERHPTGESDPSSDTGGNAGEGGTETVDEGSSRTVNQSEPEQDRPGQSADQKKNELEISSNDAATDAKVAPAVPSADGEKKDPVHRSNLKQLMGISLNQTREQVIGKYGAPVETFVMENEADPLTVYRYSNFQVGFDRDGQVEFVDVISPEADPGLNGVRLGTTVDVTIKVLGKPDIQTEYVLNYISETTILKMDIDPNTKQINSIKLFAP
jgi:hypothetical protein